MPEEFDNSTPSPEIARHQAIRVLLADDMPQYHEAVPVILNHVLKDLTVNGSLGALTLDVVHAYDGSAALKIFEDDLGAGKSFDFILTDYMMPGLGGVELALKIRGLEKEYEKHTAIYLYSSLNLKELKEMEEKASRSWLTDLFDAEPMGKEKKSSEKFPPFVYSICEIFESVVANKLDTLALIRKSMENSAAEKKAGSTNNKGTSGTSQSPLLQGQPQL